MTPTNTEIEERPTARPVYATWSKFRGIKRWIEDHANEFKAVGINASWSDVLLHAAEAIVDGRIKPATIAPRKTRKGA